MMITLEHIKQHIPNITDSEAKDLASKLNLLAASYRIDVKDILSLLQKGPAELEEEYKNLEQKRLRLKSEVRNLILGE